MWQPIAQLTWKTAVCLTLMSALQMPAASSSQVVPHTEGKTLDGAAVVFPNGSEKPLLLVVGFSHKGGEDVSNWNKRLEGSYQSGLIDYYELADLQGVPSLIVKGILHGMRHSIQEPERSHFMPLFEQGDRWKKLVNYGDSKIAYVVLANGAGEVAAQVQGPADDAKAAEITRDITQLRSNKH